MDSDPGGASPFHAVADGVVVAVRVTAKAARVGIDGLATDADGRSYLSIRVTAPAQDGKANKALIKLLAKCAGVPASRITLTAGAKARRKRLHIAGDPTALRAALSRAAGQGCAI